ncbi:MULTISPECIES: AraC family transcriptional regulator [unclassified Beijerinckia]|uniref:AraC family transcriptional regulator n=1 Tax=unclassified Beijerinckia TaxID=2638183 RepID=UPI00089A8176|nr:MULTISPECIES: AraC family transcriptional regulator [unclassified Beijerinckia]MDH7798520.1 AraC-like DNA-binding protein [Beijerinckia sp. GAS462]SED23623.1 transcriptional regulator, AraC family [Beijerinckia sp. 28-YEA-48]
MIETLGRKSDAFETRDPEMARAHLSGAFRSHRLDFRSPNHQLTMEHRTVACGSVSFHRLKYGGDVRMSSSEMDRFYLFQLARKGSFQIWRNRSATTVLERTAYAVNARETFAKDWASDGEQLILRVERTAIAKHLQSLLASGEGDEVEFRSSATENAGQILATMYDYVAAISDRPARFRSQVEEMILSTIIATFPNNYTDTLERPQKTCAPYYIHRVEEAIEADPRADFPLHDMIEISGVSARTLYYGFRQFRDTTPLNYLRDRKLDLVRRMLLDADPTQTTVTSIATECGFAHLSKFAVHFRERFGETPSAVLKFKGRKA